MGCLFTNDNQMILTGRCIIILTMSQKFRGMQLSLFIGDLIVIFFVVLSGFASHGSSFPFLRVTATYFAFLFAWFAVAPWFGAYELQIASRPQSLFRFVWAAVVSAPLGAVLRGMTLGEPVQVTFVLVMAIVLSFGIGIWRILWILFHNRKVN